MKYMLIDASGMRPAFYAEDVQGPYILADGSTNPAYPAGVVAVSDDVWADFLAHQGLRIWNGKTGAFDPYTPPPVAPPPPTVTGNQWAFALSTLGLSAAWQAAVTKSKASDQVRAGLIARDTPLLADDPLLARVAANAGNDTNGNPLIAVSTVFTTAQGMPL